MSNDVRCIAILSAMSAEIQLVRRALRLSRSPEYSSSDYQGVYQNVQIRGAITSMGLAAAERKTNALFAEYGKSIDHVFVLGIAGSDDAEHKIGEVVNIESVIDERDGVVRYPVNPIDRTAVGKLFSTDALILDQDGAALMQQHGASLVDMESGAIAAVCERYDCPFTIIRAVSDKIADGHLDGAVYQLVNSDGSPKYREVIRYVLGKPSRVHGLIAMAVGSHKAIRSSTSELLKSIDALLGVRRT